MTVLAEYLKGPTYSEPQPDPQEPHPWSAYQDPNEGMTHDFSAPGVKGRTPLTELTAGLAISPLTIGADVLGIPIDPLSYLGPAAGDVRKQLEGQGIDIADKQALINPATGKPFTGDTLRDLVGLDPESGWGQVGEALGGWDAALMKFPALAKAVMSATAHAAPAGFLTWLMTQTPNPGEVLSWVGFKGTKRAARTPTEYIDVHKVYRNAEESLDRGDDPLKVFLDTGWFRDGNGDMMRHLSNKEARVKIDKVSELLRQADAMGNYGPGDRYVAKIRVGDYLEAPELFKHYPELETYKLDVSYTKLPDEGWVMFDKDMADLGVMGEHSGPDNTIALYNRTDEQMMSGKTDRGRSTLLHEIEHWIQNAENFTKGHNSSWLLERGRYFDGIDEQRNIALLRQDGVVRPDMALSEMNRAAHDFVTTHYPALQGQARASKVIDIRARIRQTTSMNESDFGFYLGQLDSEHVRAIADAAQFLHLGDQEELIQTMLTDPRTINWAQRAMDRYRLSGGEVNARLTQFLRNHDEQEVISLMADVGAESPADLARVMSEGPVRPGEKPLPGLEIVNTPIDRPSNLDILDERSLLESPAPQSTREVTNWMDDAKLLSKEEALSIITDRNSTGYQKELARHVLTGDRFRSIDAAKLFEIADELGMVF